MLYGEKLKYIREKNEIIQKDIASIIGVERGLYSQYETEYFIMPIKHLSTICDTFHISLDYIFNFSQCDNYPNTNPIDIEKMCIRLKEFRKENSLTQVKLAKYLNISQPAMAKYENAKSIIATPFLYMICKKYNISADYLLGKIDYPKYLVH